MSKIATAACIEAPVQEAAHEIYEVSAIKLSAEDQQRFAEALIAPAPLTPAMERAISRHRCLIS